MRTALTVVAFVVRELWMTYRLLLLLTVFVAGAAVAMLLPASLAEALERLGLAFGAGAVVTATVAAAAIAGERTGGRIGWLAARSVPRRTYLAGRFVAVAGVALAGLGAGAVLGWLSLDGSPARLDPSAYVVAIAALATLIAAGAALGTALGTLLAPTPAGFTTLVIGVGLVVATWASGALDLPAAAAAGTALAPAIRVTGAGMLVTATLLVIGMGALDRAEL